MATYRSELFVPVELDQRSYAQSSSSPRQVPIGSRNLSPNRGAEFARIHTVQPVFSARPYRAGPGQSDCYIEPAHQHQRYPSADQLGRGGLSGMSAHTTTSSGVGGRVGGNLSTEFGNFGRSKTLTGLGDAVAGHRSGIANPSSDRWHNTRPMGSVTLGRASTLPQNGLLGPSHDDSLLSHHHLVGGGGNSLAVGDAWYDEMKRRFDERKQRWDDDMRRMRDEFFRDPFLSRTDNHSIGGSGGATTVGPVGPTSTTTAAAISGSGVGLGRGGSGVGVTHELNAPVVPGESQPVSTVYERGVNGQLHFIARFSVLDFPPEQVRVSVRQNQLIVTARCEQRSGSSSSSREFTRSVELPRNVLETQITATVTADCVLVVDCPLRHSSNPPVAAGGLESNSRVTSSTPTVAGHQSPAVGTGLTHPSLYRTGDPIGTASGSMDPGGRIISGGAAGGVGVVGIDGVPRFHLELPIGTDYLPTEIQIRTLNQRVYINARHEERTANRTTFREFSKEYDIPDKVDPQTVEARLEHGILYIEASKI